MCKRSSGVCTLLVKREVLIGFAVASGVSVIDGTTVKSTANELWAIIEWKDGDAGDGVIIWESDCFEGGL